MKYQCDIDQLFDLFRKLCCLIGDLVSVKCDIIVLSIAAVSRP